LSKVKDEAKKRALDKVGGGKMVDEVKKRNLTPSL